MTLAMWEEALVSGVLSLESGIFSVFDGKPRQVEMDPPLGLPGAWTSLSGQEMTFSVGVLGEYPILTEITRRLTGIPDPKELDVTDAITEVANIVCGVAKRTLSSVDDTLTTGVPLFFFGRIVPPKDHAHSVLNAQVGSGSAYLVALIKRESR
jgi:hypothetical protein